MRPDSGLQSNPYKQSDHSLCLNSTALLAASDDAHFVSLSHTHAHTKTHAAGSLCTCDVCVLNAR